MSQMSEHRTVMYARSCLLRSPRGWITWALLALLMLPGAAYAACGTMNVPDAYTTPSTSPMVSGGSISINVGTRCDGFGLNPYPDTVAPNLSTSPSHGTVTVQSGVGVIHYTNNGDGATSDSFVVTDASDNPFTVNVSIAPATSSLTVSPAALPTIQAGVAYSQGLSTSGGVTPYTYTITSGSLPANMSMTPTGVISGTPTATGTYAITVHVTDSTSPTALTVDKTYGFVVADPILHINPDNAPHGVVTVPYSTTLTGAGGTAPYTFQLDSGSLPPGLTLASDGTVSGTPTAAGSYTAFIRIDDSTDGPGTLEYSHAENVTFVIDSAPTISMAPSTLPSAVVASDYNQTISASGGSAPYSFAVTSGNLPAGLSLDSDGTLSGAPTAGGEFDFTVTATDSNSFTGSRTYALTVAPADIALSPGLASTVVGMSYAGSITAKGGTEPYTYAVTAGALPPGLTLGATTGAITGTATAGGTFDFTVTATDNSTGSGPYSGSGVYQLVVYSPNITLSPATLPDGATGTAYSQTLTASGGTAPYSYAVTAGDLPDGLSLSSAGVLSGTPTASGTFNFTVNATDSSTGDGPYVASGAYELTIASVVPIANPVSATVAYGSGANPITLNLTGGAADSVAVATPPSHGTAIASGTAITYQPAAGYAGADSFTYTATSTDGTSAPATVSITVSDPTLVATPSGPLNTQVAQPYNVTFTWSGGAAPYINHNVTGLPAGLAITASDADSVTVSGTPTAAGSFSLQVTATDSSTGNGPFTESRPFTLDVTSPGLTLTPAAGVLPDATYSQAWSQSFVASGGTAPYSYMLTGAVPTGLSLDASTGVLSGTVEQPGTFNFTVTATDSSTGPGAPYQVAHSYTLTALADIDPGPLANGAVAVPYSQTVTASGGVAPYTFAMNLGTTLPPGLSLAADGTVSGTPTASGTYSFNIRVTDINGVIGARGYNMTIAPATIVLSPASLPGGTVGSAYAQTLTANGGAAPYSFAVTSGSLPDGLSLAADGQLTGTPTTTGTANFQVTATDINGDSGTQSYSLVVTDAPPVAVDDNASTAAGQAVTIAVTGNDSGGIDTITIADPPAHGSATVTGLSVVYTPVAGFSGSDSFRYAVNGPGGSAEATVSITVADPTLVATAPGPLSAKVGQPYSVTFTWSGGTAPYKGYSVTGLPAGLAITASDADSVTVSGTATAAGSFSLGVTATDSSTGTGPFTQTVPFTLVVAAPVLTLTPGSLPAATAESAYSQTLAASGGIGPYSYAISTGSLPAGLTLDATSGVLSGTPTVAGNFKFNVTVTDSSTGAGAPFKVTRSYTLKVNNVTITLTPATLPAMQVAEAFSQQFSAGGGDGSYSYDVTDGTLPPGLSLSTSGLLAGTPTTASNYSFTVTAKDGLGFTGAQAYTIAVAQPVPVAVDDTATTDANQAVTIKVTANDTGPFSSVAVVDAPSHGTTTIQGLDVVYTPTTNYYGNDSFTYTATGPGGTSAPATVKVAVAPLAVPVAKPHKVSVLAGKSVVIHAAADASGGPFTSAAVSTLPNVGTTAVQGTDITYTAPANASGKVTFAYTLSNHFGASQPATITVTVNPVPVAPTLNASVLAGKTVHVILTKKARGGPFTDATVVSIRPSEAGTASVHAKGADYVLDFSAAGNFSGAAQISYTLSNAYATSAPAIIHVTVTSRPDPSRDPEVLGLLAAQANATRRMALGQIDNFQRRLESLHDGATPPAFNNGFSFHSAAARQMRRRLTNGGPTAAQDWSQSRYFANQPEPAPAVSKASTGQARHSLPGGISVWTGGAVNFGRMQPGSSVNGLDFTTSGITIGADKAFGHAFTLGAGIGYGRDITDIGRHGSRSIVDSYNMAIYGSYHPKGAVYVDGVFGYQWLSLDARRYLTANGGTVHGSRDGKQWFGSLSVGYEHHGKTMQLVPYARLDMANARLDAYAEHGDGTYALAFGKQTVKTTTGNLGIRLLWDLERDYGTLLPSLRVEYRHDFQGSSTVALRYLDLLSGPVYQARVPDQSRNHALLGAGVKVQTLHGWSWRVEYQNLLDSSSSSNQSILLGVDKTFPP